MHSNMYFRFSPASCRSLLACVALLVPLLGSAQWPMPVPTTPAAQRNAMNAVRNQVDWLQNATRTAANFGPQGGSQNLWQQFQSLRGAYAEFKQTLSPQQLNQGANSLAEIDAGLDIIQQAFSNYEEDLAGGRPATTALRDLCQVLREGSRVWWQELNRCCSRLRVGW